MAEFKRGLEEYGLEGYDKIKDEPLFSGKDKLKVDIDSNVVFFAIRGGYASFYLKGCSLFKYDKNGFSTHYKYAFIPRGEPKNYINEDYLDNCMKIETSFFEGYNEIKKRAELYAELEAEGVSALYKFAPTTSNMGERYFLVDIEIAFDATKDVENERDKKAKTDRIDILLYDNKVRKLLFCEAKHYSNGELWAKEGKLPKVIKQLNKYNDQITDNKTRIIKEYTKSFEEYNKVTGSGLKPPESVHDKCGLLIFGFDELQKNRINELLIKDGSLGKHKYKIIGDIKRNVKKYNTAETIFKALSKE
jgi:hypothetical protein